LSVSCPRHGIASHRHASRIRRTSLARDETGTTEAGGGAAPRRPSRGGWRPLVARVGRWRTGLLLRGYGTCLLFTSLHQYHWNLQTEHRSLVLSWEALRGHLGGRPVEEHLVTLAACALVAFGARVVVVAFAAVVVAALVRLNMTEPWLFPAVEYVLFALLPWLAVAVVVAEVVRARVTKTRVALASRHVDRAVVAIFRAGLLTTMLFVVVHKLNADFMNATTSCENVITRWLEENWGAMGAFIRERASPLGSVVIEGSLPLVLLVWPALGIVLCSGFFLILSLVGAPSTGGAVMVMSWAFFREDDAALVRRWSPWVWWAAGLVSVAVLVVLLPRYQGTAMSRELIGLVVLMAVWPGVCAGVVAAERWRDRRAGRGASVAPAGESAGAGWVRRGVPVIATALFVANGLTPYLGLRFNYAFAMWSNLRADEYRWNSWVVPAWVQVRPAGDHFVDVREVELLRSTVEIFAEGAVPRGHFLGTLRSALGRADVDVDLDASLDDWRFTFAGTMSDPVVATMLERLAAEPPGVPEDTVRVHRARAILAPMAETSGGDGSPYERRLEPALFSTTAFRQLAEHARRVGQSLDLRLAYRGRTLRFADTLGQPEFQAFVDRLEQDNLFPPKLQRSGPQRCFH